MTGEDHRMNAITEIIIEHAGDIEAERDKWRAIAEQRGQQLAVASQPQGETAVVLAMIERASRDPTVNLEKLERLMVMRREMLADTARRDFDDAMARAKAEIPTIAKNRLVSFGTAGGKTEYRHEDLAEIARTVDPILGKYGLSYRFQTTSEVDRPITVTCIVFHRGGHFEKNTLIGPRDESGKKNSLQQIGSTLSYLQRYTLKAALGLAASNDDDGKDSGGAPAAINDEQFEAIRKLMVDTSANEVRFCEFFVIEGVADLPAKRFDEAMTMLRQAHAKREAKKASAS